MAGEDGGSGDWGKNSLNGSVNGKFSKFSNVFIFTYHHILIFVYFNFYHTDNQIYRRQHGYGNCGSGCPRSTPTDREHPSILVPTVCIIYHGRVNVTAKVFTLKTISSEGDANAARSV